MCSSCYNREWRKTETAQAAIKKSNDERNGRRKRNGKTVWGSNLWHELASKPCFICGWNEASRDIHHIVPRRHGGSNSRENLITLCPNHHRMAEEGLIDLSKRQGDRTMTTIIENRAAYAAISADTEARAQRVRDMEAKQAERDYAYAYREAERLARLPWQPLVSSIPAGVEVEL